MKLIDDNKPVEPVEGLVIDGVEGNTDPIAIVKLLPFKINPPLPVTPGAVYVIVFPDLLTEPLIADILYAVFIS